VLLGYEKRDENDSGLTQLICLGRKVKRGWGKIVEKRQGTGVSSKSLGQLRRAGRVLQISKTAQRCVRYISRIGWYNAARVVIKGGSKETMSRPRRSAKNTVESRACQTRMGLAEQLDGIEIRGDTKKNFLVGERRQTGGEGRV